ncbi:hypothetical protein EDD18DRAFT_1368674 [Armillaria luteobubalina]|uniref:SAP domain-containing protein n=1 Tax=Armillaria luteobubalina TaxID=153913 RepID=A0AA39U8X8_9AGAR|nr:hypothetical protein EDD18DRAFT_1368674 [Armillaria luteobubalina]
MITLYPLVHDASDSDDADYIPPCGSDADVSDLSGTDCGSNSDDSDFEYLPGNSEDDDSDISDEGSVYDELTSDEEFDPEDDDDDSLDSCKWKRKVQKYKERYLAAKAWCIHLVEELDTAKSHCKMAGMLIKELQLKLNAKRKSKHEGNDRTVHIGSCVVTSKEGLVEARKQEAAKEEKARAEVEKIKHRENVSAAVLEACSMGQGRMVIEGSLTSQKVGGLQDIAWNLKIDEKGSKANLLEHIKNHFNTNECLCNDHHFSALFPTR